MTGSSCLLVIAFACWTTAFSSSRWLPTTTNIRLLTSLQSNENPVSELTNTLARLDQQWAIQQRATPTSRWTQIQVQSDGTATEQNSFVLSNDIVYLLDPPNQSTPSCLIVFIGGAGLGQFPHIAYNELLIRVSDRLNAAVVAAPYSVGLDHFGLAKKVGELARKAVIYCEDDVSKQYPKHLPTYCLAHSLGCKLATIYMAATDQEFDGIGFMCFNNFRLAATIGMAKDFAERISKNTKVGSFGSDNTRAILDQVLNMAEMAVGAIGLDFSPNPTEMEQLIRMKYDKERQKKTRMFTFDDDTLENTPEFVAACDGVGPEISKLPGSHLTPVYFRLGLDTLPGEARQLIKEAANGFESFSFGDEDELKGAVDEIVSWILGKGPSKTTTRPQIAGSVVNDESDK
jgi:hypothetical protein